MAGESILKFMEAAVTDEALAEKLSALAAEYGYDFTAEELMEFGSVRPLPDEEAEAIQGGIFMFGRPKGTGK